MADDELLRRAREALFEAKVVVRQTRNQTKNAATALDQCERQVDGLIAEINARLNGSPAPKEGHGHEHEEQAPRHQQASLARR